MTDIFDYICSSKQNINSPIYTNNTTKINEPCECQRENTLIGIISKRRSPIDCNNFAVFYHIAAMNNWQDVVMEQKKICDNLNLNPICGLLGSNSDRVWVESIGLNIQYHSQNLHEYESPTLKILYDWTKKHQNGCVMYFHTKGVSAPHNVNKKYWRWLMTEQVITKYHDNLKRLHIADALGVTWLNGRFPHFSGNFWMARCDWISILEDPIEHQKKIGMPNIAGNPWKRMSAEFWLGSKPYHIVESLCGQDLSLWENNILFYNKYKSL